MRVKIYDVDRDGSETFRAECNLVECFPDHDDNYYVADYELRQSGKYWIGGGAAPLVLLMRSESK